MLVIRGRTNVPRSRCTFSPDCQEIERALDVRHTFSLAEQEQRLAFFLLPRSSQPEISGQAGVSKKKSASLFERVPQAWSIRYRDLASRERTLVRRVASYLLAGGQIRLNRVSTKTIP